MQGVIIIILTILLSTSYNIYERYIDVQKLADLIHLFELVIMIEGYMKQKVILRKLVVHLKKLR